MTSAWQLPTPVSAIIFDCDSTLTTLEGIDELAKNTPVYNEVKQLTEEAMGSTGLTPSLYQKRLSLIQPNLQQIVDLGKKYFEHRTPDIERLLTIFDKLEKNIYIISAGFFPAIKIFAEKIGISSKNIYAVDISFDKQGNFLDYDHQSPLIHNDGKKKIITDLKNKHPSLIHIGDGLNDYASHEVVTRFIGYGGVCYREKMANLCDYYIRGTSLAPVVPLSLTEDEFKKLSPDEQDFYSLGVKLYKMDSAND